MHIDTLAAAGLDGEGGSLGLLVVFALLLLLLQLPKLSVFVGTVMVIIGAVRRYRSNLVPVLPGGYAVPSPVAAPKSRAKGAVLMVSGALFVAGGLALHMQLSAIGFY